MLQELPDHPVFISPDGQHSARRTGRISLIPGSFNPLHSAHKYLAKIASFEPVFEISVQRRGKTEYTLNELNLLLDQFKWKYTVAVTRYQYLWDKIQQLSPSEVIIGIDTMSRWIEDMGESFRHSFHSLNKIRFLVADRDNAADKLLSDHPWVWEQIVVVKLPPDVRHISSSAIRRGG